MHGRTALLDCGPMLARPDPSRARSRSSERLPLRPWLLLFAAALAVRAATVLFAATGASEGLDTPDWLPLAVNLSHGAGFMVGTPTGLVPTAAVPPIAPWVASGVLKFSGANPLALALVFAGLGALIPLIVASLGMAVFGANVGRWAGWICALDPRLILTPFTTDSLSPLLVALAALCTASWVKTPRPGRALGVGLLWGIAALTHPAALVLPLGVVAWAWVPLGLTVVPSDRMRQTLLVLAGVALVVAPWTLRNATAMRAFVPVSTGNGLALLAANSHRAWTDDTLHGAPIPRAALAADHPEIVSGDAARADRVARGLALEHALAHPGESLRVLAPRTFAFAVAPLPLDWRVASASIVLLPFVAWGAVRTLTGPRRLFQSFAVLAIGWFLLRGLLYGATAGMRIPIEPLVALLAGVGVDDVRLRLRAHTHGFAVIEGRR